MNSKINKILIVLALLIVIAALANITILKVGNVARANKIEPLLEKTKEEPEIQVSEENIEVKEIPTESTEAKSEVSDVEEPAIEVSRVEKAEAQVEVGKNTNIQTNNNPTPTIETQPVQATEPAVQQQVKETPVENKTDTRKHGGTEAVSLTSETITVNYLDHYCYVSFARFECELDKCEGFNGSKSTEPIGRRGSEGQVKMKAPKAKEGFKFVRWEKTVDNSGNAPIDVYTAIYEAE